MLTKEFPTRDVMSVITGRLVSEIGGVYALLNWMAADNLFTHQLGRVSDEATAVILKLRPDLQRAIAEGECVTPTNYEQWRDIWEGRYGMMIAVPRMSDDEHKRINPVAELAEMVPADKITMLEVKDNG